MQTLNINYTTHFLISVYTVVHSTHLSVSLTPMEEEEDYYERKRNRVGGGMLVVVAQEMGPWYGSF